MTQTLSSRKTGNTGSPTRCPVPAATTPPAAAPKPASGPTLFIGLDLHNDSIAVSLAPSDTT